eukprot:152595-Karenia_brevis.AAC.1
MKAKMHSTRHECARCGRELQKEAFTESQWLHQHVRGATCMDCDKKTDVDECFEREEVLPPEARECPCCRREFQEEAFQWLNRNHRSAICIDCQRKANVHECFECPK